MIERMVPPVGNEPQACMAVVESREVSPKHTAAVGGDGLVSSSGRRAQNNSRKATTATEGRVERKMPQWFRVL